MYTYVLDCIMLSNGSITGHRRQTLRALCGRVSPRSILEQTQRGLEELVGRLDARLHLMLGVDLDLDGGAKGHAARIVERGAARARLGVEDDERDQLSTYVALVVLVLLTLLGMGEDALERGALGAVRARRAGRPATRERVLERLYVHGDLAVMARRCRRCRRGGGGYWRCATTTTGLTIT